MSVITPGSFRTTCMWMFAWTVESPLEGSERWSDTFSFKGHDVHLKFTKNHGYYKVELCAPPWFPSKHDMIVRVETENKTPLDLPKKWGVEPDGKTFCWFTEDRILEKYPDFQRAGRILTFLVCNVDPPKAEKFVQTPEHFNDVSSLEGLSSDLSVLLQNQDSGPDLELLCGEDHSIKVHKNIICARSKVISAMLKSDMSEGRTGRIEIKDMSHEVFDQFVRYLYAGKLSRLNMDIARGLYEAGDKYEVANLMSRSAGLLEENLTPDNACEMLLLADSHSDQEFKERVIDFIIKNEVFLQDDRWLPFHGNYSKLSSEVLYRFCKRQRTK